ncbi:rCG37817 [Rattus norvegicus]|uniref:RCG37817 n=1 Tax=Rattus norvegicus TaxID=10116 RepID=A6K5X3_RAT|nr:rCG37817 [Rattus norvegicus]
MRVDPVGGAVERDGDEEKQQMGKVSGEIVKEK